MLSYESGHDSVAIEYVCGLFAYAGTCSPVRSFGASHKKQLF